MSEKLQTTKQLQPIAERLRERQCAIDAAADKAFAAIADVLTLIREQGRDILDAKAHLGRLLPWSDWLRDCVPNLGARQASKYERIVLEQISDPRQAYFAFMPEPEHARTERTRPQVWELVWGYWHKMSRKLRDKPIADWPADKATALRQEAEPVAKQLWPERWT